ncbi:hypothetical protein ACOMHN_009559 [Nucella lapillus]
MSVGPDTIYPPKNPKQPKTNYLLVAYAHTMKSAQHPSTADEWSTQHGIRCQHMTTPVTQHIRRCHTLVVYAHIMNPAQDLTTLLPSGPHNTDPLSAHDDAGYLTHPEMPHAGHLTQTEEVPANVEPRARELPIAASNKDEEDQGRDAG